MLLLAIDDGIVALVDSNGLARCASHTLDECVGYHTHFQSSVWYQGSASPTLSYLAVDGKSTEVSGLIDALVLLLFNFQVTIRVHVVVVSCTSRDSSAVF